MHCGSWYTANPSALIAAKYSLINKSWFLPAQQFFSGFLPWLDYIQLWLMNGVSARLETHQTEQINRARAAKVLEKLGSRQQQLPVS